MVCFLKRSLAFVVICGRSAGGSVSPASNASAWLLSTCCASVCVFELTFHTILSRCPTGISGILKAANLGFLTSDQVRFGWTPVSVYGPTPGGGSAERFFFGVDAGRMPSDGNASTLPNAPYGVSSMILISPEASSAVMPEMSLALPLSKSAAPFTYPVTNDLPPQLSLTARSTEALKSLALTGLPSENVSPCRSLSV